MFDDSLRKIRAKKDNVEVVSQAIAAVGGRDEAEVMCFCVLTHPLDDGVRALYGSFGFVDLPFDTARSMAVRIPDLVRSGFGAAD